MPVSKKVFACQQCDTQYPKWQGQCHECLEWNTLIEQCSGTIEANSYAGARSELTQLSAVSLQAQSRFSTGLTEFDRVLGGGIVPGSVVLIGGDPGAGKSTLLMQVLCALAERCPALYITGEESLEQLALRAQRLGLRASRLTLLSETNVERIIALTETVSPKVMVIDSIQTMETEALSSAPGGVSQVRESAARLVRYAKRKGVILFFVGHVTKEGMMAGPRVLEHMVDTVLYFEGSTQKRYRVVRAIKNRFGAVNELGVFSMTDTGLKPVDNPSAIFLSSYQNDLPGSVVMVSWEGRRPLLLEIQALVDLTHQGNTRRVTVGLELNRLAMLLAILHRHAGISTSDRDIFVNAVGGLRVSETGSDLAVVAAVLSSLKHAALFSEQVLFGEIGLSGEIRPVPAGQERLKEACKQGFKRAIVPKANLPRSRFKSMEVIGLEKISQLLDFFRN